MALYAFAPQMSERWSLPYDKGKPELLLHLCIPLAVCLMTLMYLKVAQFLYSWHILMFITRLTHTNVWETIGKPCSCTQFISCILHYKSRENPHQVLKIACVVWTCNTTTVPSYTGIYITRLFPLALLLMLRTRSNSDGNKLVIYFGTMVDTYIFTRLQKKQH